MAADIPLLARELATATTTGRPVAPVRDRVEGMTLDDAYAVQDAQLAALLAAGRRVVGWKIGLTSVAMQQQLGIDTPDSGYVLDDMVYSAGDAIPAGRFIAPRVEPELAFVLGAPLRGSGVTLEEAAAAVEFVFPALEIIDSRVADWDIGLLDTVADNASCGAIVLGREPLEVDPRQTAQVIAEISVDGGTVESGAGTAVLGDPLAPLAWFAQVLDTRGRGLETGDIVLTGSFCRAIPVTAGSRVRAEFIGHAELAVTFTEGARR